MEPLKGREGDSCQKDEGEINAAKRLVEQLYKRFHHFTNILVCDALYAKASFINLVTHFRINLIIRMKDKRLHIVKDALGLFSKREPDHVWTTRVKHPSIRIEAWEAFDLEMAHVDEGVRFIRFVEHIQTLRHGKAIKTETKEIMVITTCKEEVRVASIWKMIHKRWDIENGLFHQLKTHGHMDHRFVDGLHAIQPASTCKSLPSTYGSSIFFDIYVNMIKRKILNQPLRNE